MLIKTTLAVVLLIIGLSTGYAETEPHYLNYVLLGQDSIDQNTEQSDYDIMFQISFSKLIYKPENIPKWLSFLSKPLNFAGPFYFGYTQRSFWEIGQKSSPFRETNYQPEVFLKNVSQDSNQTHYVGYLHESNGHDEELSRGWDRLYYRLRSHLGEKSAERSNQVNQEPASPWTFDVKLWAPFNRSKRNKKIARYAGYGEVSAAYAFQRNSPVRNIQLALRKGGVLNEWDRGSVTVDLIHDFGTKSELLYLLQVFNGYASSLERHDQHEWSVRWGVLLSDFK